MPPEPGLEPTPPETPSPGAVVPPVEPTPPVEPAVPSPTPPVEPATPPGEPKVYDQAYVTGLRTEAANWRTKFQAAETQRETLAREKMSADEILKADLAKYRDEHIPTLTKENQQLKVQVAASRLGIVDPEAAATLLDWKSVEAGTSVDDALTALITARPWLKGQPATPAVPPPMQPTVPPSTSSPATAPGSQAVPSFTKSQLDRMSEIEYAAQRDDILKAAQAGRIDMTR